MYLLCIAQVPLPEVAKVDCFVTTSWRHRNTGQESYLYENPFQNYCRFFWAAYDGITEYRQRQYQVRAARECPAGSA